MVSIHPPSFLFANSHVRRDDAVVALETNSAVGLAGAVLVHQLAKYEAAIQQLVDQLMGERLAKPRWVPAFLRGSVDPNIIRNQIEHLQAGEGYRDAFAFVRTHYKGAIIAAERIIQAGSKGGPMIYVKERDWATMLRTANRNKLWSANA